MPVATATRRSAVAQALAAAGADVEAQNCHGETALIHTSHHARASNGQREMTDVLVAAGADREAMDKDGKNAAYDCHCGRIS